MVALKICDPQKKTVFLKEVQVLGHLTNLGVNCIPKLIDYNHGCIHGCDQSNKCSYIAMKLLGPSLRISRKAATRTMPFETVTRLAVAMNANLQAIHNQGYVHRDIKPGNFAISRHSRHLYILDFGIARRFVDDMGEPLSPRPHPGFRGSLFFASVAAHHGEELSPRDDYWSLLFSLIEMLYGHLPWSGIKDKTELLAAKEEAVTTGTLVDGLPECFVQMYRYIQTMEYGELADGDAVKSLFATQAQTVPPGGPTRVPMQVSSAPNLRSPHTRQRSAQLATEADKALERARREEKEPPQTKKEREPFPVRRSSTPASQAGTVGPVPRGRRGVSLLGLFTGAFATCRRTETVVGSEEGR